MRGRKPIPSELHEKKGTHKKAPQRRPKNKPEPVEGLPACPEHLVGPAREEWERVVSVPDSMGLANQSDLAALEVYCRTYGDWRNACEQVARMGAVIYTKKNDQLIVRRNPFDIVREKNAALCLRLLTEFGLTPSSRSRCQAEEPVDENDPFMQWMRAYPPSA